MADGAPQLHDLALQAEKSTEALATALAQAGAGEQTVQAVTQIAEVLRKIVSALGQGQQHTADNQPPADNPKDFGQATDQMMSDHKAANAQQQAA